MSGLGMHGGLLRRTESSSFEKNEQRRKKKTFIFPPLPILFVARVMSPNDKNMQRTGAR